MAFPATSPERMGALTSAGSSSFFFTPVRSLPSVVLERTFIRNGNRVGDAFFHGKRSEGIVIFVLIDSAFPKAVIQQGGGIGKPDLVIRGSHHDSDQLHVIFFCRGRDTVFCEPGGAGL